jgi:hypothetical protein
LERHIVNTAESAMKVWVSQERQQLEAKVLHGSPLLKRKI